MGLQTLKQQIIHAQGLLEENQTRFWKALRVEIHFSLEKTQIVSGLDHPLFNGVLRTMMASAICPIRVEETIKFFKRRGLPFHWVVGEKIRPANISKVLENKGLRSLGTYTGLISVLDASIRNPTMPQAVEIVPVEKREYMKVWGDVFSEVLMLERGFVEKYSLLMTEGISNMRHFIVFCDGRAAAIASVFFNNSVAEIHHIAVRDCFRGLGITSALIGFLLHYARRIKCTMAMVYVPEDVVPFYEELSFAKACNIKLYIFSK